MSFLFCGGIYSTYSYENRLLVIDEGCRSTMGSFDADINGWDTSSVTSFRGALMTNACTWTCMHMPLAPLHTRPLTLSASA